MQLMTKDDAERFLVSRIRSILDNWEAIHKTLDEMTPEQRDVYVHRRIEDDLAMSHEIRNRVEAYIALRWATWKQIMLLDVIALLVFIFVGLRDLRDWIGLAILASILIVSRIINYRLMGKATAVLSAIQVHLNRETQTATLDFLVDEVQYDGGMESNT